MFFVFFFIFFWFFCTLHRCKLFAVNARGNESRVVPHVLATISVRITRLFKCQHARDRNRDIYIYFLTRMRPNLGWLGAFSHQFENKQTVCHFRAEQSLRKNRMKYRTCVCIHCISTNIFNYVYIQIYKYVRQDRSLKINVFLASYCRYIYVQISIWNAILSTNLCMCVELAKIYIHNIRYIYDTLCLCVRVHVRDDDRCELQLNLRYF